MTWFRDLGNVWLGRSRGHNPIVSSGEPGCPRDATTGDPRGASLALSVRLPARPESVAIIRGRLGDWLAALDWPELARDDLLLAAGEAIANVVDHAYHAGMRGDIDVRARLTPLSSDHRRVSVTVADTGTWRASNRPSRYRGHGLRVMHGCVAECHITTGDDGTTVELISRPVPAQP